MRIGIPKEIKQAEYRVSMLPEGVAKLVAAGHSVWVESGAGDGVDEPDGAYQTAGATICTTVDQLYEKAELIVKVKEPQAQEIARLKPHHILFTYLHLAADPVQTQGLIRSKCTAIAYETVVDKNGHLPLLAPMSAIAGKLAAQEGAACLKKALGGRGVLMGGLDEVPAAKVLIIGGGVVGLNAGIVASGMGAKVSIVDRSSARLEQLAEKFGQRFQLFPADHPELERAYQASDLIIGAALVPGGQAPKVISREQLKQLQKGCVLVDVAIDQGGCFASSRPTTHSQPTFIEQGVVHYCVTNMPGSVPITASQALTQATFPYVFQIAELGEAAIMQDIGLRSGLNIKDGWVVCEAVAQAQGLQVHSIQEVFAKKH